MTPSEEQETFEQLIRLAREYFPNQSAKAEAWVSEQATRYGIMRAKEVGYGATQSIWLWVGVGALIGFILRR